MLWRADPSAVAAFARWRMLWQLVRAGAADEDVVLAAIGRPLLQGGLLAATVGLRDAGLRLAAGALKGEDGLRLARFAASLAQQRTFLHAALFRRWWGALRSRRRDFGAGPVEVDFDEIRGLPGRLCGASHWMRSCLEFARHGSGRGVAFTCQPWLPVMRSAGQGGEPTRRPTGITLGMRLILVATSSNDTQRMYSDLEYACSPKGRRLKPEKIQMWSFFPAKSGSRWRS